MIDELQLLREVFQHEETPDALAMEHLEQRLKLAFRGEGASGARSLSRFRSTHIVRQRLALTMVAAALLIGGVVVSVNGLSSQSVASASPFRLASYVTIPGFQVSSQSIQFANNVTCPTSADCYLEARFMDAPTAAAGNNVYFSNSGGSSWQQLSLPNGVYADTALSCTSSQQCSFGGGQFNGVDKNGKPIMEPVLVSTFSGGASWVVEKLPMPTNGPFELLGTAFIGSLQCFSSSTCNAVLWANFGGPGYNTVIDNVFMRTSDGGRSWNSSILPGQPAPSARGTSEIFVSPIIAMSCPSTQFCVASTLVSSSDGRSSIVWRTENGGATWSVGSLPNGLTSAGPISCPDMQHCWIVAWPTSNGTAGHLLESSNGGASWVDRSPLGTSLTTSWLSASCPTDNNCWLAGQTEGSDSLSVVYASSDAGQTWNEASLPTAVGAESAPLKRIDTIDCNTKLTCIVLGIPQGVSEDGLNEAVLTNAKAMVSG
jgi:photosystem II stability/assembly factor-like uncharacterized protein